MLAQKVRASSQNKLWHQLVACIFLSEHRTVSSLIATYKTVVKASKGSATCEPVVCIAAGGSTACAQGCSGTVVNDEVVAGSNTGKWNVGNGNQGEPRRPYRFDCRIGNTAIAKDSQEVAGSEK